MRKITLVLFGLFMLSVLTTSCKKDEAGPQFELADLLGVWEVTSGTDFVVCPTGNNMLIEITDTEIELGGVDENGCNSGGISTEYEFKNGNTFDGGLFQFKVTSLNDNIMTATVSSFGSKWDYELQKLQ